MDQQQEKAPASIPFFVHENMMMHYNRANRRMFFALIAVGLTAIIIIAIFTSAYTAREKDRNDTYRNEIMSYIRELHGSEATDGIYKQPDAASDP